MKKLYSIGLAGIMMISACNKKDESFEKAKKITSDIEQQMIADENLEQLLLNKDTNVHISTEFNETPPSNTLNNSTSPPYVLYKEVPDVTYLKGKDDKVVLLKLLKECIHVSGHTAPGTRPFAIQILYSASLTSVDTLKPGESSIPIYVPNSVNKNYEIVVTPKSPKVISLVIYDLKPARRQFEKDTKSERIRISNILEPSSSKELDNLVYRLVSILKHHH